MMMIYLDRPTCLHLYAPPRPRRQRLNPARLSSVVKPVILPDILNVPPKDPDRCFSALYKADLFYWTRVQSSRSALCPTDCWSFPNDNTVAVGNYRELHSRQSLTCLAERKQPQPSSHARDPRVITSAEHNAYQMDQDDCEQSSIERMTSDIDANSRRWQSVSRF